MTGDATTPKIRVCAVQSTFFNRSRPQSSYARCTRGGNEGLLVRVQPGEQKESSDLRERACRLHWRSASGTCLIRWHSSACSRAERQRARVLHRWLERGAVVPDVAGPDVAGRAGVEAGHGAVVGALGVGAALEDVPGVDDGVGRVLHARTAVGAEGGAGVGAEQVVLDDRAVQRPEVRDQVDVTGAA